MSILRLGGKGLDGLAKAIRTDNDGYLIVENKDPKSSYNEINYYPFSGIRGTEIYKSEATKIMYSNDYGLTWRAGYTFPNSPSYGFITSKGSHLILVGSDLYRSTDKGISYTLVLSDIKPWLGSKSISENNIDLKETICFAEYDTVSGSYNIWRSANDGVAWTSVFIQQAPAEIRHFHSCQYNYHDRKWYVTSGDSASQTKWFVSEDDGVTWSNMPHIDGTQKYRTLGLIFRGDGTIIWGADSAYSDFGVWKANLNDLSIPPKLILPLDTSVFGIYSNGHTILVSTLAESAQIATATPAVYRSNDGGNTWDKIIKGSRLSVVKAGFVNFYGADLRGRVYMQLDGSFEEFTPGTKGVILEI